MFIGLILLVGGFGLILYQNPVMMESLEVSNFSDETVTEYTGDVYVYNMVKGNDELELKFNDGEYKNVEYSVFVYYVNHTGISSEGFGGGGSSSVENYNSFSDSWSQGSELSRKHKLDNKYAFALVDVSVDDSVIDDDHSKNGVLFLISFTIMLIGLFISLLCFYYAINIFIKYINSAFIQILDQ